MLARSTKVFNLNLKQQYVLENKQANELLMDGYYKYYSGLSFSQDNQKFALFEEYSKITSKCKLRIFEVLTAQLLYEGQLEKGNYCQHQHEFTLDSKFYIYLQNVNQIIIINILNNSKTQIKKKNMRGFSIDSDNDIYVINEDHAISKYSIDAKLKTNLNINNLIFKKFIFNFKNIFQQNMVVIASQTQYMINFANLKIKWQRQSQMVYFNFIKKSYFLVSCKDAQLQQTRNGRIIRSLKQNKENIIIEGRNSVYLVFDLKPKEQETLFEIFDIILGVKKQLRWANGKIDLDLMSLSIVDQTIIVWNYDKNIVKWFEIE